MEKVRTRFAPSPTGYMHIGNLRTALFAYLYAKANGGDFILRIEDTDQGRYVEGATQVIYDTLKVAGLKHDEGPDIGGAYGPYIQSERKALYKEYALELVNKGLAYYCFCEKKEQDDANENNSGYDRHCRNLSKEEVEANLASGRPYVIRQKIPLTGQTSWDDLVYGTISVENDTLDDQILLKSDGMPTYNFANVIDDHLMHITHIVRGSEYLSSNPKYLLLYQAFGWEVPQYIHLPLINGKNPDGTVSKLSKRHGAVSFQALVEKGFLPEAIINYIALLGWSPRNENEIFSLEELIESFSISGVHKNPAVFDYQKLDWVNNQHLQLITPEKFQELAFPFSKVQESALEVKWPFIASLLQSRLNNLSEIPEKISFLFEVPDYNIDLYVNKKNKSTIESSKLILKISKNKLLEVSEWTPECLFTELSKLSTQKEMKVGHLLWSIRIALSGLLATPGGATDILYILGKDESIKRIDNAIKFIEKNNI